jgi:hypothetical protein
MGVTLIFRKTARRAFVRKDEAAGIKDVIVCDPDMTLREAERGCIDAAEKAGIPLGEKNIVIKSDPINQRGNNLVSYAGKPVREVPRRRSR